MRSGTRRPWIALGGRPLVLLVAAVACAACSRVGVVPDGPPPPGREPFEGYGASTVGGAGGRVITISEPSEERVRRAFADAAATGHAIIRFEVTTPIAITRSLPQLVAPGVTIEGGGAVLDASGAAREVNIIDVRTHDVIVRDLRLRNGQDNLRVTGPDAFDVVIAHVSSTGAGDDGISIGYGAHDVTVQYAFLAGNTRSVFCKYDGTTRVSLHHTWMQKAWARSPLFSGAGTIDVRNVIVEDWGEWGARLEDGATGNVVASLFALSPQARGHGGKAEGALRLVGVGPVFTEGNVFRVEAHATSVGTAATPVPVPRVQTLGVTAMEPTVRARAGCLPRDSVDAAYIALQGGWDVSADHPLRLGISGADGRIDTPRAAP